ncbi:MAG: hypothetical protein M0O99_08650, partial [Desulfuromonas thiophila]|nr:hypothetical protein [Desulfuromonas thiophila]
MIDLNTADLQGTGAGVIPPGSIVPLTLTIRPPRAGKEGSHELLCRSDKGNEFLDIEFEADGQFAGRKIWQNLTVRGSDKAAAISMRTLRAVVESARGIDPHDASPAATASRKLNDWADLNGMTFLARLGCELERGYKDGRWYVNNIIKQIITPDM